MKTKKSSKRPNVLIILTDEQRANLHLPEDWQKKNLPSMEVLRRNGVEFERGFCNTCMCSPSRSSLMTSLYPAQTGVTDTQTFGGIYSPTETFLDPTIPNLGSVFQEEYDVHYRGKWHLSKGNIQVRELENNNLPNHLRGKITEF